MIGTFAPEASWAVERAALKADNERLRVAVGNLLTIRGGCNCKYCDAITAEARAALVRRP